MIDLPSKMTEWARRTPGVAAVVMIGSQARPDAAQCNAADEFSDWDFVVFTARPGRFATPEWLADLGVPAPLIYAVREGTVGSAQRITAIFPGFEADFVMVPALAWRLRRWAFALRLHRRSARLRRSLADLAMVARPGYRFLHGSPAWRRFYDRAVAEIADPRLSDEAILRRAQVFAADCVWLRRKIARGEYVTARRQIFRSLLETNLQLLHELKLRRGQASFPEGRRFELVADERERPAFDVGAVELTERALTRATNKAIAVFDELMWSLVGDRWFGPGPGGASGGPEQDRSAPTRALWSPVRAASHRHGLPNALAK